jgi:hypothetical protein
MDWMNFQNLLAGTHAPWLPDAVLARWAMHVSWGVLLGAAALGLCRTWRWRWLLALVAMLSVFLPGSLSPAFWLGLAFQVPSLSALGLCALLVWRGCRTAPVDSPAQTFQTWPWSVLASAVVVLGWVLLLDMLAWWPVSVYAWGFSPAALTLVSGLALCLWLVAGASHSGRSVAWTLAAVLTVFVLTRLPSGNLWDALLDPWLWLVIQWAVAVALWRRVVRRRF